MNFLKGWFIIKTINIYGSSKMLCGFNYIICENSKTIRVPSKSSVTKTNYLRYQLLTKSYRVLEYISEKIDNIVLQQ